MKKITTRIMAGVLAAAICVSSVSVAATKKGAESSAEVDYSVFTVVLDPGHDGTHKGAQYYDHAEEDDVLKIAGYCRDVLEEKGVTVYMTREDKNCGFGGDSLKAGDCLKKRVEFSVDNNADYFVSFHLNAAPSSPTATGAEVYYSKRDGASSKCASLAGAILRHLSDDVGLKNRGIKRANFAVLNGTTDEGIPGVLIEHCFMTNEEDVDEYLSSNSRLKKLGEADAAGILEYLSTATQEEKDEDEAEEPEAAPVDITTLKVDNLEAGTDGFFVSLTWDDVDDADAYQIYKLNDSTGKWSKLAETDMTDYTDTAIDTGVTGTYKVRATHKEGSTVKNSKFSAQKSAVAGNGQVTGLVSKAGSFNRSILSWEEVTGADGYKIWRQTYGSSKWKTITDSAKEDGYIDETTSCSKGYRYKVRAYRLVNNKKVWGKKTKATEYFVTSNGKVTLNEGAMAKKGVQVNWAAMPKATGYLVYKKDTKTKKWVKVGKTTDSFYVDKDAKYEKTYTYTVKAYRQVDGKKYYSADYDKKGVKIKAGTKIEGKSRVTVDQMVAYYEKSGKTYPAKIYKKYGASTLKKFCQIVYDVSEEYNIRAELVWAQICKETGYLQFGGDVKPKQCNFAGIGATGGGVPGNSFSDVREGVTAQVQHLKLYASTKKDWESGVQIVDPRYNEKLRGKSVLIEWLGIPQNPNGSGWAAADGYGYHLISMINDMRSL